ncbi:BON domain-containing protein [Ideonella sp. BN130291]|uniref:BON domain-containing protein n=1 Tax=Ideonella sp. BN130291 TaxID=3112940 RepID=UPI002E26216D|nr:BON domain-containing protein [Ideonella sp. BN130291]
MAAQDGDIEQQVTAALEADPRIDLRRFPIQVRRDGEALRLEGEVDSISAKRVALALARKVCGDGPVVDGVRLVADRRPDGEMRDALVHALQQCMELHNCTVRQQHRGQTEMVQEAQHDWPSGEIGVACEGGEITLEGKVISLSHKRMIEAIAWRTPGCCNVVNRLRVEPAEDDNDDELTDAVRLVLEMDRLAHADQINVRSDGGVVTLAGVVPRDEEKRLAEMDAWRVCGVVDVRNRIEVRPG